MTDAEPTFEGVDADSGLTGRRVVVGLYVLLVGIATGMGVILSVILGGELESIALFGVIDLPPTPLGFGLYGAITVGIALGVPLLLVYYVSERSDASGGR